MLREQFFAIRSKRRKLGEEPGRGKARTGLPPVWHWELWSALWREGGWVGDGMGAVLALWGPLSLLSLVGSCAPLSPGHILPAELRHRASPWQRNLGYPLAMLGLLALTVSGPGLPGELRVVPILPLPSLTPCSSQGISVLIVCFHVLELLLDDAAMPRGIQVPGWGEGTAQGCVPHRSGDPSSPTCALLFLQDASLGQVSFSIFGSFGAALQVVLILYPSDRHLCPQRCPLCSQNCSQHHPILFSSLTLLAAI